MSWFLKSINLKMKYLFFIVILLLWLLLVAYTFIRGNQAFLSVPAVRWVYLALMTISFLSFFAGFFLNEFLSPILGKTISFIGYSFLILSIYLFFSFLMIDIVRLLNHFLHFIPDEAKFRTWSGIFIFGAIIGVMIIGNVRFNNPKVVNIDIQSSRPTQNKEVKIVALSDIHLGTSIDKKRLKKYVDLVNSQHPDMVLIGGDLIDRSLKPVIAQKMDEELRQLRAPFGVFAVEGNHEHFGEGGKAVTDFFEQSNITLIQDSTILINDEFYLVGREDHINSKRLSISQILNSTDPSKPRILLDHQPYNLSEAEQNDIDFQFSGHTHKGQFFPINLVVNMIFEQGYGYLQKGNTHYYISSGLGIWGPQYRIGSQSEVVVVKFRY